MRRTCLKKPARMIAGLLTGLLFAIVAVPLGAQPAPESRREKGFGPVYDVAHEKTLNGTIREVVTKRVAGSPAGMHLLVAGPEGVVDSHVGSFLSKQTKESLQAGASVRIVGAMSSLHGKDYFLVRQLTVGGRTIKVRSERGVLEPEHSPRAARTRVNKTTKTTQKGESL
jgi:hypothetical protein